MSQRSDAGKISRPGKALEISQHSPHRDVVDCNDKPKLNLQPMSDLDLMIENGWGDTPQVELPDDWRTRKNWP